MRAHLWWWSALFAAVLAHAGCEIMVLLDSEEPATWLYHLTPE